MTGRDWQVEVQNESNFELNLSFVTEVIIAVLGEIDFVDLPQQIQEVSILFSDDSNIKELNSQHRGKNQSTDVLSFSAIEGIDLEPHETNLGDIIISLETAKRQAADYDNTFPAEILRLLVHGLLHLAGYDHEAVPESEVIRMQNEEDRLNNLFSAKSEQFIP